MKVNKATSVEEYKIVSSFHTLRKTLLEEKFRDRLEKPLAYWALPNDRRLPLAFLGRTIKDLLDTPFEELSATPGIGQKKISSLVKLLSRATKDQPPAVPFGINELAENKKPAHEAPQAGTFDPTVVSEALWSQWRETVEKHGVGREKLGRLAPTLQSLPTVIWHTRLDNYTHYTVAEIRQLKTHGEKRVRVVLEIFYIVHTILGNAGTADHLSVRLVPKFIDPLEDWFAKMMEGTGVASAEEIRAGLARPLLEQIKTDVGEPIYQLAAGRLGIEVPAESVRNQAKRLGVTRARVYQLLEDCAKVMDVRWPEGERQFAALLAKIQAEAPDSDELCLLRATAELFYPGKKKLSDEDDSAEAHEPAADHDEPQTPTS